MGRNPLGQVSKLLREGPGTRGRWAPKGPLTWLWERGARAHPGDRRRPATRGKEDRSARGAAGSLHGRGGLAGAREASPAGRRSCGPTRKPNGTVAVTSAPCPEGLWVSRGLGHGLGLGQGLWEDSRAAEWGWARTGQCPALPQDVAPASSSRGVCRPPAECPRPARCPNLNSPRSAKLSGEFGARGPGAGTAKGPSSYCLTLPANITRQSGPCPSRAGGPRGPAAHLACSILRLPLAKQHATSKIRSPVAEQPPKWGPLSSPPSASITPEGPPITPLLFSRKRGPRLLPGLGPPTTGGPCPAPALGVSPLPPGVPHPCRTRTHHGSAGPGLKAHPPPPSHPRASRSWTSDLHLAQGSGS